MVQIKIKIISVRLPYGLYQAVIAKSEETAVNYSEVVRRALENWVATGILPPRVAGKPDEGHAGA